MGPSSRSAISRVAQQGAWLALRVLGVLASGFLVDLAAPSSVFSFSHLIAWIALVPLALALHRSSPTVAAALGLLYGTILWSSQTAGLPTTLEQLLATSPEWASWGWWGFCVLSAVPYALFGGLHARLPWFHKPAGAMRTALLWAVLVDSIPAVFPVHLAHSQALQPEWVQLFPWGGSLLLHWLMVWSNWLLAHGILRALRRRRPPLIEIVTAGLIPLGVWSFGKSQLAEPSPPTERLRVGWVQPNFSTLLTDKAASTADPLDQLLSQTDSLIQSSPALALLVWPEVPFPLSWIDYADQQLKIRSAVQTWQVPLLLVSGTVDVPQQIRGEGFAYRNEAHWIAASGVLRGQYAKRQLVPFGEELPWEEEFPALREWFPHARRYLAGEEAVLFPVTSKVKVLPLICYEIASPAFHREGVQQQAQLIWNPTNDGWFPERMAQWHRALAQSRSVESGLPLLRVSNSGESVFTDAQGRVLASAAWNTRAQGVIEVALPQDVAAWPYIDQEVLWGLQAWCLLDVGLGMLLRKKREEEESEEEAREPANRP